MGLAPGNRLNMELKGPRWYGGTTPRLPADNPVIPPAFPTSYFPFSSFFFRLSLDARWKWVLMWIHKNEFTTSCRWLNKMSDSPQGWEILASVCLSKGNVWDSCVWRFVHGIPLGLLLIDYLLDGHREGISAFSHLKGFNIKLVIYNLRVLIC